MLFTLYNLYDKLKLIPHIRCIRCISDNSQICPSCQAHTGRKDLSIRVHICPECNYSTTRDIASALIIKQRGEELIEVPLDGGERKQSAECVLSGIAMSR